MPANVPPFVYKHGRQVTATVTLKAACSKVKITKWQILISRDFVENTSSALLGG